MKSVIIHSYSIKNLIEKINHQINKKITPTLAFVYTSPRHNIRKLVVELNSYPFLVFGATTAGEIFADETHGVKELVLDSLENHMLGKMEIYAELA